MTATERDRDRALTLYVACRGTATSRDHAIDILAEALAAERERARAPFVKIAEEWATTPADDAGLAAYTAMRLIHNAAAEDAEP